MSRKKRIRRTIKTIDSILSTAFLAVLLLLLLFAVYIELDAYHIVTGASSSQYQAYKPSADDTVSFDELVALNPDVIGWLTIDGTNIDYPLVQGASNNTYINRDVFKEFSLTGSIFLDSRNAPDFSDTLSIVYGHNMAGEAMFGGIDRYEDPAYFNEHLAGTLFYGGAYYRLRIFAYFTANGYDAKVYNVGLSEEQYAGWVEQIVSLAVNRTAEIPENGPILLMSTCASGETNGRTLLAASIEPGGTPPEVQGTASLPAAVLSRVTTPGQERLLWPYLLAAFILLLLLTAVYEHRKQRKGR